MIMINNEWNSVENLDDVGIIIRDNLGSELYWKFNELSIINKEEHDEISDLEDEIRSLEDDCSNKDAEICELEEDINDLEDQIDELKKENERLDKYNSELCVQLTIIMDKLCLAENDVKRLSEDINNFIGKEVE